MPLPLAAPVVAAAAPAVASGTSAVISALALKAAEGAAVAGGTYLATAAAPIAIKHAKALKSDIEEEQKSLGDQSKKGFRERISNLTAAAKRVREKQKKRSAQSTAELAEGAATAALTGAVEQAVSRSNPAGVQAEIQQMLDTAPSSWKSEYNKARNALRNLGMKDPGEKLTINGALQVLQLTAGGRYSGEDPGDPGVKPPADVQQDALHGLRLSHQNNYGAWMFIGIARGILLALGKPLSATGQKRMKAYFSRHKKDKQAGGFGSDIAPSKGYMAWLNWGGEPGKEWLEGMMRNNPRRFFPEESLPATRKLDVRRRRDLGTFLRMLDADLNFVEAPPNYEMSAQEDGDGVILNIRLLRPRSGETNPAFSLHVPVRNEESIPYLSRFIRNIQLKKPTTRSLDLLPAGTELRSFQVNPMRFSRRNPVVGSHEDFRMHSIDTAKHLIQSGEVREIDAEQDPQTNRFHVVLVLNDGRRLVTQKFGTSHERALKLGEEMKRKRTYAGGYQAQDADAVMGRGGSNAFLRGKTMGLYKFSFFPAHVRDQAVMAKLFDSNLRSVDDMEALMRHVQHLLDQGNHVGIQTPDGNWQWKYAAV